MLSALIFVENCFPLLGSCSGRRWRSVLPFLPTRFCWLLSNWLWSMLKPPCLPKSKCNPSVDAVDGSQETETTFVLFWLLFASFPLYIWPFTYCASASCTRVCDIFTRIDSTASPRLSILEAFDGRNVSLLRYDIDRKFATFSGEKQINDLFSALSCRAH